MHRFFLAAAFAAATSFAGAKTPAPKATPAPKVRPTATPKVVVPDCPNCGMPLHLQPTLVAKVPVKINGKTYYCCPFCGKHNTK